MTLALSSGIYLLVLGMYLCTTTPALWRSGIQPWPSYMVGRHYQLGSIPTYVLKLFEGVFMTRRWDSWSQCLQQGSKEKWKVVLKSVRILSAHLSIVCKSCLNLVTPFWEYSHIHTQRVCFHGDSKSDRVDSDINHHHDHAICKQKKLPFFSSCNGSLAIS